MFTRLMLVGLLSTLIQNTVLEEKVTIVKRDLSPALEGAKQALRGLNYTGDVSTTVQDSEWYATTKGKMLEYTTPSKEVPVKWDTAVKSCRDKQARIWDQNPQLGLGFEHIKYGQEYWIASDNGVMAEYTTTDTPEIVYD